MGTGCIGASFNCFRKLLVSFVPFISIPINGCDSMARLKTVHPVVCDFSVRRRNILPLRNSHRNKTAYLDSVTVRNTTQAIA